MCLYPGSLPAPLACALPDEVLVLPRDSPHMGSPCLSDREIDWGNARSMVAG